MSSSKPLPPIEHSNLSVAWGKAFLALMRRPLSHPGPMVVSVTGFSGDLPAEDERLREAVDEHLLAHRKQRSSVSAMIVFPYPQWLRKRRPPCEGFSRWCIDRFVPRLKARCPQNRRGLYFERMMDFRGGTPDGMPGKNQLLHLIEWWRSQRQRGQARPSRSRMQVACFDPFADHNRDCRPYFPCLQQVAFSYDDAGGLTVTAFYPTHYIFDRAYGNYLGLCHLGAFMAHELDLSFVRLNCLTARAELGGDITKGALRSLEHIAQEAVDVAEGRNDA